MRNYLDYGTAQVVLITGASSASAPPTAAVFRPIWEPGWPWATC